MLIGVPLETAAGETRVAVTPETAKKLKAQGHTVRVQSGAGVAASATDAAYEAAGADITDRAGAFACELVLKVRSPDADELSLMKSGTALVGMLNPFDKDNLQPPGGCGLDQLRAGSRAAHHARAEHGRAVQPGQHRRLQGRDDGRRQVPAPVPDADDGGRHHQGRARGDPGRWRGGPAGHCHRQAPGRSDRGQRRAAFGEGAGRIAGREVHRRALRNRRGTRSRRGRGRLCQAHAAELDGPPEGRSGQEGGRGRHRDQHGADPGPRGARAHHARRWWPA